MPEKNPLTIDFAEEKEEGYRRIFSRSPLLNSLAAGWNGIYFAYDYQPPGETPEVFSKQHGIAIFTDVPTPIQAERKLGGRFRREQVVQGNILITPANVGSRAQWNGAGGVILLGFEPSVFAHAVYEAIDLDRVELLPHFSTPDPLVHQMGLAIKMALENHGPRSRLYVETMANALIVHLLQHYAAQRLVLRDYSGGLPKQKLQQVIDYVKAHLGQNLSLEELAALAQMSSHYFSQLFKQSAGITLHQYVIRCRIEQAQTLLQTGELTIAEVAKDVGFVDQSHLHRYFKRLLGITPKTFLQEAKGRKNLQK